MQRALSFCVVCGVVGGVIAGGVVALWFLVFDLLAGTMFSTPANLASLVVGQTLGESTAMLVIFYTILHFGVFAFLGAVAAWLLSALNVQPGLLVGALFGLVVLSAMYYGGLLVSGANLLEILPSEQVLVVNVLGGMALMAYLHRALQSSAPFGWRMLERNPVLSTGVTGGALAGGAVAVLFFLLDIVAGQPFQTPAALGSAVFLGAESSDAIQVGVGIIGGYTLLHFGAFVMVGVAFAWVGDRVAAYPGFWLLTVLAFIVLDGLFIGVAGLLSARVLDVLGWSAIALGNVVAVAVMGTWVWRHNPKLRERITTMPEATRV
jgi:hypothetical protein